MKRPNYRVEFRLIGPSEAEELLKQNFERNTRLYRDRVDRYATDLREGRWNPNAADPMYVSDTGKLLNGKHRLTAIIETGIPMWVEFRIGVPEDTYSCIDCGRSRTAADFMPVKNASAVAALCNACITMSLEDEIAFRSFNVKSSSNTIHTSTPHVVEYWTAFEKKYPGYIEEAVGFSRLQAVKDTEWNQTGIALAAVAIMVSDKDIYKEFKGAILNDADARKSVITFKKWMRNAGKTHGVKGNLKRYWSWCAAAKIVTAIKTGKDVPFKYKEKDGRPDGDTRMPGFTPQMLRVEEKWR